MSKRIYLMPLLLVGGVRSPKYLKGRVTPAALDVEWAGLPCGQQDVMLVSAEVTQGQHSELVALADVAAFPLDLDNAVTAAALPTVKATLDSFDIPSHWVNTSFTYRRVLRRIMRLFFLSQQLNAKWAVKLFNGTITPASAVVSMPENARLKLTALASSLGVDVALLPLDTKIREVMRLMMEAWPKSPIELHGVSI